MLNIIRLDYLEKINLFCNLLKLFTFKYLIMVNAKLLNKLKERHPNRTNTQLRAVIFGYLSIINNKLSNSQTLRLVIPKLGVVHTHGNTINKSIKKRNIRQKVKFRKTFDYSDKNLLF